MIPEQPDWAVRAAEEIRQISDTTRHKDYMAQVAAIIRANSPDVGKLREALDGLKAACVDVLIPSINEAIKGGFKMETWAAEQMQFAQAVKETDEALASVPQPTERIPLRTAAQNLLAACEAADARGELAEEVDGSLMDAVRDALKFNITKEWLLSRASDEGEIGAGYAAESIPAETLTDELATALDHVGLCTNDVQCDQCRDAFNLLARYKAMKGKQ